MPSRQGAPVKISIAAQPLDKALLQFGQQTRLQVYFLPEAVRDLKAPAVSGSLTAQQQALDRLLAGSWRPIEQHRRHRAARRNRDAVRRAGVRRHPAAGLFPALFPARSGATLAPPSMPLRSSWTACWRFRPGGPHRRQHRRHRARARRNPRRCPCRCTATAAAKPSRAWSRAAAAPAPRPTRRSTRFLRPSTWSPRATGDDRRDRHQPGAALHSGLLQLRLGKPLGLVFGAARFHPTAYVDGLQVPRP